MDKSTDFYSQLYGCRDLKDHRHARTKESSSSFIPGNPWRPCGCYKDPQQEAQHLHGVGLLLPKHGGSGKSHLPALPVFDWKGTQSGDCHPCLRQKKGCPVPDERIEGLLPPTAGHVQPVHIHHHLPQPPAAALCVCEGTDHRGAFTQLVLCHGPRCTVSCQNNGLEHGTYVPTNHTVRC